MRQVSRMWAVVSLLLLSLAPGARAQGQQPAVRADVDTVLTTLRVRDVLMHVGEAISGQIDEMAPDLPPDQRARLRDVVARNFTLETLYEGVASKLTEQADAATVAELVGLLTRGPVAEAREAADAYLPSESLEQFMVRMKTDPLPNDRVALISRLAYAQQVGHFYVTLAETSRGAAHTVLGGVVDSLPRFHGLDEDQVMAALDASYSQAMISFLYRFEGVPDDLITAVAEAYESPPAQWYVTTYARAVGDAVLDAAERARGELNGRP